MTELARRILRKGIGSMRSDSGQCDVCRRTPVPGEFIHQVTPDRVVCSLCLAHESVSRREHAVAERVHAAERQIRVARRAA